MSDPAEKSPEAGERQSTRLAPASAGPTLVTWMVAVLVCQGMLWATGLRGSGLAEAVERGAARAESRGIGELTDDLIREAIRTQRATRPFWTTLAVVGDFILEPLAPAIRAIAAATLLSGLAALTGRPVGYGRALAESARDQRYWVLGLATRTALMLALRREEIETSAVLLLPPGSYPAPLWVALRQVDPFALVGWAALALGGWRRKQANLVVATGAIAGLALIEAVARIALALVLGAAIRLTLVPEFRA